MGRLNTLPNTAQDMYNRMQEVQTELKVRDDKRHMCIVKGPKDRFKGITFGEHLGGIG